MKFPAITFALLASAACSSDTSGTSTTDTSSSPNDASTADTSTVDTTSSTPTSDASTMDTAATQDTTAAPIAFESEATATVTITIQMPAEEGVTPDPIVITAAMPGTAAGTWDPASGALVAGLTFDHGTFPVATADATVIVGYELAAPDDATGAFSPTTGQGALAVDLVLTVATIQIGEEPTAVEAPCDVGIALALTGAVDLETDTLSVTEEGFSVTPPGETDCGGLGGTIGLLLGGPTNAMTVSFSVAPSP